MFGVIVQQNSEKTKEQLRLYPAINGVSLEG
jgi:hypothetical protein